MSRPRQVLLALAAVLVFAAAVVAVAVKKGGGEPPAAGSASERSKSIMTDDGVTLAADVFTPERSSKAPLLVMPAAWGQSGAMYRPIAQRLAESGYVVVAYAQRGFQGSGGKVDLAGARTQRDVSDVIDWALRTTKADKSHVGAFGISYGAGVSLLAAAKDVRIRAVVALSTWTDLAASFNPNDTPNTRAISTLFRSGSSKEQLDASAGTLRSELEKSPARVGATIDKLSPERSAANYVSQLNANKPAIMLANGYQDSLFGPGQLVTFFDQLTTKKRLQLAPGDHGGPEASALQGKRNSTVNDAEAWLDHFLRGVDNGVDSGDSVVLTDSVTGAVHAYRRWPQPTARDVVKLGAPGSKAQIGAGITSAWSSTIVAGLDTVAGSGGSINPFGTYRPPKAQLVNLSRQLAFAWTGPVVDQPTLLSGTPELRVQLSGAKSSGTIVCYLYDVDDQGVGTLISMQPYSFLNRKPGETRPVSVSLQPVSWTLPQGHRFVLVTDTQDPRYTSLNASGARLTATSSKTRPAEAVIPFG